MRSGMPQRRCARTRTVPGVRALAVLALIPLVLAGSSAFGTPAPATPTTAPLPPLAPAGGAGSGTREHRGSNGEIDVNVCSDATAPGVAHCLARVRTEPGVRDHQPGRPGQVTPAGAYGNGGAYDPAYLQSAYNAPSASRGVGQTVAIVDAYDSPSAAADLTTYRAHFNLPACTETSGCFRKLDQRGGTSYPAADAGWAQEISLDVQMVSAVCPNCHVLLVEADSSSLSDLGLAVNQAVALGATVVSNSYGGTEFSGETFYTQSYFNHPGVAVVASSGDNGYGVEFPAASAAVTAVGGTSLIQYSNTGTRNGSETAWSGAGSGCSGYEPKPSWQHDASCANRTVADVSAVADPNTGVWVYDSYATGGTHWLIFGGTSVAAPVVGAMYALAGNPPSSAQVASYPYADHSALNDVLTGSNGTCTYAYQCHAGAGYDGPTGWGTPNGVAAFSSAVVPPPPVLTVPTAPQRLTATAADKSVKLAWSAPVSPGGPVTYSVYRGTAAGGESLVTSGVASTSVTDGGLTDGTTYYYKVTATNSAGQGPASNEVSARPFGVPGAPQSLVAAAGTTSGIGLTWQAPSSNGGSTISSYRVYRGGTATSLTLYTAAICSASTCSFRDSGARYVVYYYQVAAVNSTGVGPLSNQASAKAP